MKASEIVEKMVSDFETKHGKPPTEIKLAPSLYDSLKEDLRSQLPAGMVIDFIKIRGCVIERSS